MIKSKMYKSLCLFMCLCYIAVSNGADLAPFIEKCKWDDKACLISSTTKAIPYFAKGLPDIGIPPMDPLKLSKVNLLEGELTVEFTTMDVTGTSNAKVLNVERDISKNLLKIEAECPIDVIGNYEAKGKLLFVPIEGKGPFNVNCKNVHISVEVEITPVVGEDGLKHWKIGKAIHEYEVQEKATIHLENLFNGDVEKAEPILKILNENWKELMHTIARPIVDRILDKIVEDIQIFADKVSADQLEL